MLIEAVETIAATVKAAQALLLEPVKPVAVFLAVSVLSSMFTS